MIFSFLKIRKRETNSAKQGWETTKLILYASRFRVTTTVAPSALKSKRIFFQLFGSSRNSNGQTWTEGKRFIARRAAHLMYIVATRGSNFRRHEFSTSLKTVYVRPIPISLRYIEYAFTPLPPKDSASKTQNLDLWQTKTDTSTAMFLKIYCHYLG